MYVLIPILLILLCVCSI